MATAEAAGTHAGAGTGTEDREIVLTRVVRAPRDVVFRVWTDPMQVHGWWGPDGFSTTIHEMDVRVGGVWRFTLHGPDGTSWPNRVTYREVAAPARLVYDHDDDKDPPQNAFHVTATFDDEGGATRVTMRMLFPNAAARNATAEFGAVELGNQTLGRLAEHVERLAAAGADYPPFEIARELDAPRDLVFRVWTEGAHLHEWWGPKGFEMTHLTNDLRSGGTMHYGMRSPDGFVMWGRWVYREVAAPERLSFVVSFSDENQAVTRAPFAADWPLEVLSVVTFEDLGGRTRLRMTGEPVNATDEERRTFFGGHASMQQGWGGTFAQLTDYLARLR